MLSSPRKASVLLPPPTTLTHLCLIPKAIEAWEDGITSDEVKSRAWDPLRWGQPMNASLGRWARRRKIPKAFPVLFPLSSQADKNGDPTGPIAGRPLSALLWPDVRFHTGNTELHRPPRRKSRIRGSWLEGDGEIFPSRAPSHVLAPLKRQQTGGSPTLPATDAALARFPRKWRAVPHVCRDTSLARIVPYHFLHLSHHIYIYMYII